ncbi:flagellar hook-length control protein FliK [Vibrio sp. WJH972]
MNIDFIPSAKSSPNVAASNSDAELVSTDEATEESGEGFFAKLSALFKGEAKSEVKSEGDSLDVDNSDEINADVDVKKVASELDVAEGQAVDELAELEGEAAQLDDVEESDDTAAADTKKANRENTEELKSDAKAASLDTEKVMESGDKILDKLKQANSVLSQSNQTKQDPSLSDDGKALPDQTQLLDEPKLNKAEALAAMSETQTDSIEEAKDSDVDDILLKADLAAVENQAEVKQALVDNEAVAKSENTEEDLQQMAMAAATFFETKQETLNAESVDDGAVESKEPELIDLERINSGLAAKPDEAVDESSQNIAKQTEVTLAASKDVSATRTVNNVQVATPGMVSAEQSNQSQTGKPVLESATMNSDVEEISLQGKSVVVEAEGSAKEAKLVRQPQVIQSNLSAAVQERMAPQVGVNSSAPVSSEVALNATTAANAMPSAAAALGGMSVLAGTDTKAKWSAEHIEQNGLQALESTRTETGKESSLAQQLSSVSGLSGQMSSPLNKMEAMPAQVPVMVNKEVAADQLSERVQMMLSKNLKNIDIRLDPPELGRMQIRMNMNGDSATVHFTVANQHARDALEGAMPRLRDMLAQQGVQLGETGVQQQNAQQQQGYASGERGQSQSDSNHGNEQMAGDESFPTDVKLDVNLGAKPDGISYYA